MLYRESKSRGAERCSPLDLFCFARSHGETSGDPPGVDEKISWFGCSLTAKECSQNHGGKFRKRKFIKHILDVVKICCFAALQAVLRCASGVLAIRMGAEFFAE